MAAEIPRAIPEALTETLSRYGSPKVGLILHNTLKTSKVVLGDLELAIRLKLKVEQCYLSTQEMESR